MTKARIILRVLVHFRPALLTTFKFICRSGLRCYGVKTSFALMPRGPTTSGFLGEAKNAWCVRRDVGECCFACCYCCRVVLDLFPARRSGSARHCQRPDGRAASPDRFRQINPSAGG